ncbi:hypothetical protein SO802_001970 [Lithocarpus litseifolius]|uniref:Reverse transcriptase zinc-binding domain-containing protein n=1 Tax=Lithocarpus litseifolius TaxID=425828 RepID=A0AAW2E1L8_9ROSI
MHPTTGARNTSLLKQIFLPGDVHTILSIPLGSFKPRDRLIWAYTPRGLFIVNIAYKLALSMNHSLATTESSDGDTHSHRLFWRTIWGRCVPNKVKAFTWKACRNILPTEANLCHRHVLSDSTCEACNLAEETSGHFFWECTKAKETWNVSGIPVVKTGVSHGTFADLLWYLIFIQHFGQDVLELTVMISWCMWFNCNRTRLGSPRKRPQEILSQARFMLEEFLLAHHRPPGLKDAMDNRWVPPAFLWYKINTDAAVFSDWNSWHRSCDS